MKNSLCTAYSLFDLYLKIFKKETKSAEMHIYITINFDKRKMKIDNSIKYILLNNKNHKQSFR